MNINDLNLDNPSNMNEGITPKKLFVEQVDSSKEGELMPEQRLKITEFLNNDIRSLWYRDGYRYPNAHVIDNAMRLIRSEFREVIDDTVEECRETVGNLPNQTVELNHIALKAEEKVNKRIAVIQETIARLMAKMETSATEKPKNNSIQKSAMLFIQKGVFNLFFIGFTYLLTSILEAQWDSFQWSPIGTSIFYIINIILITIVSTRKD